MTALWLEHLISQKKTWKKGEEKGRKISPWSIFLWLTKEIYKNISFHDCTSLKTCNKYLLSSDKLTQAPCNKIRLVTGYWQQLIWLEWSPNIQYGCFISWFWLLAKRIRIGPFTVVFIIGLVFIMKNFIFSVIYDALHLIPLLAGTNIVWEFLHRASIHWGKRCISYIFKKYKWTGKPKKRQNHWAG